MRFSRGGAEGAILRILGVFVSWWWIKDGVEPPRHQGTKEYRVTGKCGGKCKAETECRKPPAGGQDQMLNEMRLGGWRRRPWSIMEERIRAAS